MSFAHSWVVLVFILFGCIIYVIEQHGIKSMRAFHHFCIFFNAHTHTAGSVGTPYRIPTRMPHNIIINAKTMYDSYMHECEHTANRFLFLFFSLVFSRLNLQGTRRTLCSHNTDGDGGWHAQWERLYGVEHAPYARRGCVCQNEKNSTTMEFSFSKHESNC